MGGTSTLKMYATADETLLQPSKFPLFPFNLAAF
jgi:hypothetical protein